MNAVSIFVFFLGLLLISLGLCTYGVKRGLKPAKAVVIQLCSFVAMIVLFAGAAVVTAKEGSAADSVGAASIVSEQTENAKSDKEWDSLAMAIVMGLACIGSGIAVAAAAPAAIGAVSEDPKAFGKAIVFVGLAEGVSIFGLLIAIFIKFV